MSPFLSAYFARTGWQQPVQVNIDTLRGLHLHHNCAIPFENIDVVLPREIHLDDGCLVDKLVTARRGGYCFEQNGLFERVLREVGFTVRSVLGRVVLANPSQMPPRTHRLLLVELNGERRCGIWRTNADGADSFDRQRGAENPARELSFAERG